MFRVEGMNEDDKMVCIKMDLYYDNDSENILYYILYFIKFTFSTLEGLKAYLFLDEKKVISLYIKGEIPKVKSFPFSEHKIEH